MLIGYVSAELVQSESCLYVMFEIDNMYVSRYCMSDKTCICGMSLKYPQITSKNLKSYIFEVI